MVWKPPKLLGLAVAFLILSVLIAINLFVVRSMIGQEIGLPLFLKIVWLICNVALLVVGIHWTVELGRLHYHLDRDALTIHCGTHKRIVPLEHIEGMVPATNFQAMGDFEGLHWPGYWRGCVHIEGVGNVRVYATKPPEQLLIAVTGSAGYAISPQDEKEFLGDYAARRDLEPLHPVREHVEHGPVARWPVWQDASFWSIFAAAFLISLVLSGYLMQRYRELPPRMVLRLPSEGGMIRVVSRRYLLTMPGLAGVLLVFNTLLGILLHHWERLGAYLLLVAALGIQLLFILALTSIL